MNKLAIASLLMISTSAYAVDFKGAGTENDPYLIENAEQLAALGGADGYYALACDIDLEGIQWTPVSGFIGDLDGRGYSIKNANLIGGNKGWSDIASIDVGIFGDTGDFFAGTVTAFHDLTISNTTITLTGETNMAVGALCAAARGTEFDNVTISGVTLTSTYEKKSNFSLYIPNFGAIAGEISNDSHVRNCTVSGLDYYDKNAVEVGALVGTVKLDSSVENCTAQGTITAASNVGGIVGYIGGGQNAKVLNCMSEVNVSGNSSVGGIIGSLQGGTVARCYAKCEVSAMHSAGGIVGYIDSGEIAADVNNCISSVTLTQKESEASETNPTIHAIAGWTSEDSPMAKEKDAKHISQGVFDCYTTTPHVAIEDLDASDIYINVNAYYTAHEGTVINESELGDKLQELGINIVPTGIAHTQRDFNPANASVVYNLAGQRVSTSLVNGGAKGSNGIVIVNGKKIIR